METNKNAFPNKTVKFLYKLCCICYYSGMPNFWMSALPAPRKVQHFYRIYSRVITVSINVLILFEIASIFTQKNLTRKQESNQLVFIISHPVLWSYCISFCRQGDQVRKILVDIIKMKEVFNDVEVEQKMIKKSKFYSTAFCGMCSVSMLMYTFDGVMHVIKEEGTFTTIITAWPLVEDTSAAANLLRLWWNLQWWLLMGRVVGVYTFVFSLTSCMSHQFVDLQSYFRSLNLIFETDKFSQKCKERQYEAAYKIGIKLHCDTLECVKVSKTICSWLFSGQIIFNVIVLVMLMAQLMKSERSLMHVAAIGIAALTILLGTGLFMCNAGDVTVEASELCTAMYSSGWQNCQGPRSVSVRRLLMTSMIYAQQPVVLKGLGIVSLSYQSYVSLVKSTYSVFSLVFQQTP